MHVSFHPQRRARRREHDLGRARAAAEAGLGDRHPLVVVLARLETSAEQVRMVAIIHAAGLVVWAATASGAALVAGAVAAELVLGCRIVVLRSRQRSLCVELIATGLEHLPVAAVVSERARLATPRHQAQLARTLERLVCPEPVCGVLYTARPIVYARVVNAVAAELDALVQVLRNGEASCRSVAIVEQLISSPMSPLYGTDADELRRALGRVRYLA